MFDKDGGGPNEAPPWVEGKSVLDKDHTWGGEGRKPVFDKAKGDDHPWEDGKKPNLE